MQGEALETQDFYDAVIAAGCNAPRGTIRRWSHEGLVAPPTIAYSEDGARIWRWPLQSVLDAVQVDRARRLQSMPLRRFATWLSKHGVDLRSDSLKL